MLVNFMRWIISQIGTSMRAPNGGFSGWLAMTFMNFINRPSIEAGIKSLDLKSTDTFVEIGAGHGFGLQAVEKYYGPDNVPSRYVCVEISPDFFAELEKVKPTLSFADDVEIHSEDCKSMPYLDDNSVDKIFAMNVVYFLDPLDEYLKEIHRVLKPQGFIVFGVKKIPSEGAFVNCDQDVILAKMKEAGLEVSSKKVDLGDEKYDFTELKGTKTD